MPPERFQYPMPCACAPVEWFDFRTTLINLDWQFGVTSDLLLPRGLSERPPPTICSPWQRDRLLPDYRISRDSNTALSLFSSATDASRVRLTAIKTGNPYSVPLGGSAGYSPPAGAIIVRFLGHGKRKKAQNPPRLKSVVFWCTHVVTEPTNLAFFLVYRTSAGLAINR